MAQISVSISICVRFLLGVMFHVNAMKRKFHSNGTCSWATNCVCVELSTGEAVWCTDGDIRGTVEALPRTIVELEYIITERFVDHNITFSRFSSLRSLTLTAPPVISYDVPESEIAGSRLFEGLPRLERLSIHLNLKRLNSSAFSGLTNLTELDLSHTRNLGAEQMKGILEVIAEAKLPVTKLNLTNIRFPISRANPLIVREDVLRPLDGVPIEVLDISNNGLVTLHSGYSRYVPMLRYFRWRSHIVVMDDYGSSWICSVFDFLVHPSLKHLDLGDDGLPRRQTDALRMDYTSSSNDTFKLSSRTSVCQAIHSLCPRHEKLPCEYVPNSDELLDPQCWNGLVIPMHNLEVVAYSHADFRLYGGLDGILNADSGFCISPNNNFRYLDFSFNNFRAGSKMPSLRGFDSLRYFNLQGNKFTFTAFDTFDLLPKLEVLLLSGNNLNLHDDTESRLFRLNTQLRVLDLEGTGTISLLFNQFQFLSNLIELNLSRNSLAEFNVNLTNLRRLRVLNLSFNRLNTLPRHVIKYLDGLDNVTLDISENGFLQCQCADINFVTWLQTTNTVNFANRQTTLCSHPQRGMTYPWNIDLAALKDHCHPSFTRVILISVLSTIAVLVLGACVYAAYRHRWIVRWHLHAARNLLRRKEIVRAPAKNYQYDAFVVYNSEDRHWVHDTMRPTLEDNNGLRLCLHYRNFIPGRFIEDTIVESIDKSRKTVLVLSANFLKSDWCYFEYKMARQTLITEGRDVLVLVKLGSLPASKVSRTMARLLQKKTYVEWTPNPEGQNLFWEQLVKAITDEAVPSEGDDAV